MIFSISRYYLLVAAILILSGCAHGSWAGLFVSTKDPNKKPNLAKEPIGIHVEVFANESGTLAYTDVTVKNNSGSLVSELHVEVLWFQDTKQVADVYIVFESLSPDAKEHIQRRTRVDGYLWNHWTFTYKVQK